MASGFPLVCTRKLALWCRIWHLGYHQSQPKHNRIKNTASSLSASLFFAPNLLWLALCFSNLHQSWFPTGTLWLLSGKWMSDFQVSQNPDYDTIVWYDQFVRKNAFFKWSPFSSDLLYSQEWGIIIFRGLIFRLRLHRFRFQTMLETLVWSYIQRRLLNASLQPRDGWRINQLVLT